jgi:hypothetical protein
MRTIWRIEIALFALLLAAPAAAQDRFLLLATNRTGTMQDELNAAGANGYRFAGTQGGETAFGGNEVVVVMERDPEERRFRYILLATSRTGTMERELNGVPPEFGVVGMTVFSSTFGGKEAAVILEAEASALTTAPGSSSSSSSSSCTSGSVPPANRSDAATAASSGIYLICADGSRQLVTPSIIRRVEEEGGGLFRQPRRFAILDEIKAATRSSDHFQVFDLVDSEESAVNDFVLVQFYEEPEYNERTLDVLPGGVNLEIVIPVRTERFGAGAYRLRPTEPLGLGEFGFFRLETGADIARGLTVYDFGIDP